MPPDSERRPVPEASPEFSVAGTQADERTLQNTIGARNPRVVSRALRDADARYASRTLAREFTSRLDRTPFGYRSAHRIAIRRTAGHAAPRGPTS
jgi:hypothetical protein